MAKWTRETTLALVALSRERPVYIDSTGRIRCPSPALIASRGGRPPKGWTKFTDDPRTKVELAKDPKTAAATVARERLMAALAEDDERERQASKRAPLPSNRKRHYRPGVRR